jgi:SAM-dependent methyltransferase
MIEEGMTVTPSPSASAAIAANRDAWDASAPLHRRSAMWHRLVRGFADPDFTAFDDVSSRMKEALLAAGVAGADAAQICCNNGRETISLKVLGAKRAVGFDISAAFLQQAEELAAIAGRSCEFVLTDANAITSAYEDSFDIVLITIGVFGWMPDLSIFMRKASSLLRAGGRLIVHEEHPVANMFEITSANPMEAVHSYFKPRPFVSAKAIVYEGENAPDVAPHYWFVHPMSAVLTEIIHSGLTIEAFSEFGDNISSVEFDVLQKSEPILPLSYLLTARKISGR